MQKKHWFWIVALIGASILPFLPTVYQHTILEGTDRFEAHYPIWAERSRSITLDDPSHLGGIGFIIVNLRRASVAAPAHVMAYGRDGDVIFETDVHISSSSDDTFTWVKLPSVVRRSHTPVRIVVSAPRAERSSALGIRLDTDTGEVALAVREQMPLHKYLTQWTHDDPATARTVLHTFVGGVLLYGALLAVSRMPLWGALLLLACVAIAIRIPLAASIDSAYGGDAFNYLLKSRAFIDGLDPFVADPRKAPLYSLLVLPGLLPYMDAVMVERWVSSIAAALSAVVVSLLLVRLKLPRAWALAAGVLLAVNRDFQFESVQGLANTTFAFLFLLAGYLFIRGKTYLLSVASGLAFLTRYEGGLVGAILLPTSLLIHQVRGRAIVRALLPGIVLALIPFVFFPFTHSLGVRTLSDIQSDDGLYVAYSFDDFASNAKALRTWFGRLWMLTPNLDDPFVQAMTVAAMIGSIVGMFKYPRYIIPLTIMLLLHTVLITAILPKDRYYLPLIPYIACAGIAGIYALVQYGGKPLKKCALVATSFLIAFVYVDARQALSGQVSEYNEKSTGQTVLLNASRTVKKLSGVVAVAEGSDLQTRAYLPNSRVVIAPDSLRDIDAQLALLREKQVAYIIDTTENPYFTKLIEQRGELFEQIAVFKTKWGSDTATLYRIKPT